MENTISIKIDKYDGDLLVIQELRSLLTTKYSNLFSSVIVHGSIATDEVIPYSDFDGLLIVKDKHKDSQELRDFKHESMRIILNFDPLQHHGWFQVLDSQLENYPENYLPHVILQNSKLIYPIEEHVIIDLKLADNVDYTSGLIRMIEQFENRQTTNWRPSNVYQEKSVLSQIMLLPSMYYSVKNKTGIFKRDSFDAIRPDFSSEEWMPIKTASNIRVNWKNSWSSFSIFLLKRRHPLIRRVVLKFLAPSIPKQDKLQLTEEFYRNLDKLTTKIREEVQGDRS